MRAGFRSPQQRCGTQRPATVGGHYTHLTLRVSTPHEKHWLQPNFPALLLNSSPPYQVTASGSLFRRKRFSDILSYILSYSSVNSQIWVLQARMKLISSCAFLETHNKSPFYLKRLVLTNQNQLGFQTIIAMDPQNPHKSKITMTSLFYAVSTLLWKQRILLIWMKGEKRRITRNIWGFQEVKIYPFKKTASCYICKPERHCSLGKHEDLQLHTDFPLQWVWFIASHPPFTRSTIQTIMFKLS